jgi:hypothetical protein
MHRMFRSLQMLSSLALLFAASAVASTDAPAHRIVFKRGAVTADVGGRLTGMGDTLRYVLKARAGQHMQHEGRRRDTREY